MTFGKKLKKLRTDNDLTQDELAEKIFITRTAISKWESDRGYPSIDSLKTIAKFFNVTIDDLLSGDELLNVAEEENNKKENHFRSLVCGLLDLSFILFFFLPFFGQKAETIVEAVSLPNLIGISPWLKTIYFIIISGIVLSGILTLALEKFHINFPTHNKNIISLILNAIATLIFIISLQPYAAAFLFIFLIIKATVLIKK